MGNKLAVEERATNTRWKSRIFERGGTERLTPSWADTERLIGSDEIDGGEVDEEAGGYIGVNGVLGIEKRRDRPALSWEDRLVRIIAEDKGWKASLKLFIREITITSEKYSFFQKKQCYG